MIRINSWFRWPFLLFWAFTQFGWYIWGFHSIWLTYLGLSLNFIDLFWISHSSVAFVWTFLAFDSSAPIRISSWLKQYLKDLNRFNSWLKRVSRSWLKINWWLKWIPQVLVQIDSWLKVFSHISIQINSWLKRKAFDSEWTQDSTLSHTHVCLGQTCPGHPLSARLPIDFDSGGQSWEPLPDSLFVGLCQFQWK